MDRNRIVLLLVALLALTALPNASAAFSSSVAGDRLILTQTADDGLVSIDNNGAGGEFRVLEGVGTTTFVAANSLEVLLLDNSHPFLALKFDNPVVRDVVVDFGNGSRAVSCTGTSNTIGGHLELLGGTGDQTVELAVNAPLSTGGDLRIDLDVGHDIVDEDDRDLTIGGDLLFRGVNSFENDGTMLVVGNVDVRSNFENQESFFDDDQSLTVLGNFRYKGGPGRDRVFLNGEAGSFFGGNVKIDAGDGPLAGGEQLLWVNSNTRIAGNLTFTARNSQEDSFDSLSGTIVGGDIVINLGKGANEAAIRGRCAGSQISYKGGNGLDSVTCDLLGRETLVKLQTAGGADTVTLENSTNVRKLIIDFGSGVDTFNDLFVLPKPFKTKLKNLP